MKYVIGYDINRERDKAAYSETHKRITELLEKKGAQREQFSVWILDTSESIQSLTDSLAAVLDRNDALLVAPTTSELKLVKGKRFAFDLSSFILRPRPKVSEKTSPALPPLPNRLGIKPR